MTEAIGWAASALVVLSLVTTSIVRLRVVGLVAAGAFITYGVLIEAWPIVITNLVVALIHLWRLRGLLAVDEYFDVLAVLPTSAYLAYFCEFHRDDIRRYVPGYEYVPDERQVAVFVLRNLIPAGVFIGIPRGEVMEVSLDYAIPRYRDFKVGRFLYSAASGVFADAGVRRVEARAGTAESRAYLRRMGFVRSGDRWVLDLP
jgi:hypothetical protein